MKILAFECSATPASVAVYEDDKVLAFSYLNIKLTHSETLMPMLEAALKHSLVSLDDIKGVAISCGPGSFTGIRIGISAVKGLAQAKKLPTVGVSTLLAMAQLYRERNCIVCPVMDARCNQVYNALFKINGEKIERLSDDRALLCEELAAELKDISGEVIVMGDGADLFYEYVKDMPNVKKATEPNKYQNAAGVAIACYDSFLRGETVSPNELLPIYLRLPQAERELKTKQEMKL